MVGGLHLVASGHRETTAFKRFQNKADVDDL